MIGNIIQDPESTSKAILIVDKMSSGKGGGCNTKVRDRMYSKSSKYFVVNRNVKHWSHGPVYLEIIS